MDIYVKVSFISTFSLLFWFSNMILSDAVILRFYPYRSFKHSKWWCHKFGHK